MLTPPWKWRSAGRSRLTRSRLTSLSLLRNVVIAPVLHTTFFLHLSNSSNNLQNERDKLAKTLGCGPGPAAHPLRWVPSNNQAENSAAFKSIEPNDFRKTPYWSPGINENIWLRSQRLLDELVNSLLNCWYSQSPRIRNPTAWILAFPTNWKTTKKHIQTI